MVVSSAIASLPLLSPAISLHLRRLRSQLHPCEASSGRSRTVRATLFLTLPPLPLTLAHATVTAVHCWPLAFLQVFLWCSRSLASSLRFFLAVGVPPGCLPLAACFLRGGGCGCGCEFWPWSMWTSALSYCESACSGSGNRTRVARIFRKCCTTRARGRGTIVMLYREKTKSSSSSLSMSSLSSWSSRSCVCVCVCLCFSY